MTATPNYAYWLFWHWEISGRSQPSVEKMQWTLVINRRGFVGGTRINKLWFMGTTVRSDQYPSHARLR